MRSLRLHLRVVRSSDSLTSVTPAYPLVRGAHPSRGSLDSFTMSSIEQISSSLPFGSSTASSPKSTSLGWRLVLGLWWFARWVPWYLWLMAGIWAYANYGRGSLARKRKT